MPNLILASTSTYRRGLLERFGLPFATARPEVDESPSPGESPQAVAERLAIAKAEVVLAQADDDTWVIGSDQVAELDGRPLGKPGRHAAAVAQLRSMSGREVRFLTAVCIAGPDGRRLRALDVTTVRFRALGGDEIERYVASEQPLDCAGSFKCEGLGIALFDEIDNRDPTALIGLPLIATARLLREAGFVVP
ncbi:MAG: nucleoside triphosphate pyrophosphatase [Pseudomonadota bacterium]